MADKPDHKELARRFLDLWQDQMVAASRDPDWAEMIGQWSKMASGGLPGPMMQNPFMQQFWEMGRAQYGTSSSSETDRPEPQRDAKTRDDGDDGQPRSTEAGAKAATGLSRDGGDDMDELRRRVRELEERLAAVERGNDRDGREKSTIQGGVAAPAARPRQRRSNPKNRQTR